MKHGNGNLKDRDGRGGKDQRSRADEKIGSGAHGKHEPIVQPSGSDQRGDEALKSRGMTSELGREHWKRGSGPHRKGRG